MPSNPQDELSYNEKQDLARARSSAYLYGKSPEEGESDYYEKRKRKQNVKSYLADTDSSVSYADKQAEDLAASSAYLKGQEAICHPYYQVSQRSVGITARIAILWLYGLWDRMA